jgi:hypothetical protein
LDYESGPVVRVDSIQPSPAKLRTNVVLDAVPVARLGGWAQIGYLSGKPAIGCLSERQPGV